MWDNKTQSTRSIQVPYEKHVCNIFLKLPLVIRIRISLEYLLDNKFKSS